VPEPLVQMRTPPPPCLYRSKKTEEMNQKDFVDIHEMKTFIHKKILQEQDVENDEKKKNENKQCEISATKDKPMQKELHEADTTKNKEFAKK
jgi:hypothetical protein